MEGEPLHYSFFEEIYPDPLAIIHFLDTLLPDETIAAEQIAKWVEEHPEQEVASEHLSSIHSIMVQGSLSADEVWLELELEAERIAYEKELIESVNGLRELPDDVRLRFLYACATKPDSWEAHVYKKHARRWTDYYINLPDDHPVFRAEGDTDDPRPEDVPPPRNGLRPAQPPNGATSLVSG